MKIKKIKVLGNVYTVTEECSEQPAAFFYDNRLQDYQKEGKDVSGYIRYMDGSIVGVYHQSNFKAIVLTLFFVAVIASAVVWYLLAKRDILTGTYVTTRIGNGTTISFDAMPVYEDGKLKVLFSNGKGPVTMQLVGDGIEAEPVPVDANSNLADYEVSITTELNAQDAYLQVTDETGNTYKYPVLVEIPANNNNVADYSREELTNGETIILE